MPKCNLPLVDVRKVLVRAWEWIIICHLARHEISHQGQCWKCWIWSVVQNMDFSKTAAITDNFPIRKTNIFSSWWFLRSFFAFLDGWIYFRSKFSWEQFRLSGKKKEIALNLSAKHPATSFIVIEEFRSSALSEPSRVSRKEIPRYWAGFNAWHEKQEP